MERHRPEIIDSSSRRIARDSGTTTQDVNALLNQFRQMQKMMKTLTGGGMVRGPRGKMKVKGRQRNLGDFDQWMLKRRP